MKKRILQTLCVVLFATAVVTSFAFPLTLALSGWTKTYAGVDMDFLTPRSLVQSTDGGYAIAIYGEIRRNSSGGPFIPFTYELQILKTDQNGAVQWKRSYPTVEDPNHMTPTIHTDSEHYAIVETADHGYVVAGGNFWMFKVDSQGVVLWSKTYQLNDEAYGNKWFYSMIQTRDGGFALAGSVYTSDGGTDFWLVKTNSAGVAQWNYTYNSGTYTDSGGYVTPREDAANSVIQTSDGGYALVGSASLFRQSTSSIVYSSWVVKTDAQGKQLWNKGYDLLNEQGCPYLIVQTSDSGYAIAGTENGDFCLFRISSANQLQWSKTYGDPQRDTPCSLVQLEDGGYAVAGTWTPTRTYGTKPTMGLVRTDSSGKAIWTKTYNAKENATNNNDQANAMIRTSDGSYVLVGSTLSDSGYQQYVFFVKTETLEQPIHVEPLPTPDNSNSSNTNTNTDTQGQDSNQTQPNPSNSTANGDTSKPLANAGQDQTVNKGTQVTLDASASSGNNGISSYTWTFIDGTEKTLTGVNPSYTFSAPGVYTITLSVKDATGNEATDTIVVTVSDAGASPSLLMIGAVVSGIAIAAALALLFVSRRKRKNNVEDPSN